MRMTHPAAMLAALTLTFSAVACSSTSSGSGGSAPGKPQPGGTVTVAWTNATPNFIFPFPPATNTDGFPQLVLAAAIWQAAYAICRDARAAWPDGGPAMIVNSPPGPHRMSRTGQA